MPGTQELIVPGNFLLLRQRRARRVVAGLHRRIDRTLAAERPQSPVSKACPYALGQWDGLKLYLDHGVVSRSGDSRRQIDNLGSCLRRGLTPRAYLHWRFTRIAA